MNIIKSTKTSVLSSLCFIGTVFFFLMLNVPEGYACHYDPPPCPPCEECPKCEEHKVKDSGNGGETGENSFHFNYWYNSWHEQKGILGWNWATNLDEHLEFDGNTITHHNYFHQKVAFAYNAVDDVYYSTLGYQKIVENPDGTYTVIYKNRTQKTFDEDGKILSIKSGKGMKSEAIFTYTDGKITRVTDEFGRYLDFVYYSDGKLQFVQDQFGNYDEFIFDGNDDLVRVNHYQGTDLIKAELREYSSGYTTAKRNHNLLKKKDLAGNTLAEYSYYSTDHFNKKTVNGQTTTYTYSGYYIIIETDAEGNQTKTYTDADKTEITVYTRGVRPDEPASYITTHYKNAKRFTTKTVKPRGNVIEYAFDENGNVLEKRFKEMDGPDSADDIVWAYTYNRDYNVPLTETNPVGLTTIFKYDFQEETEGDLNNDGITDQKRGLLVKKIHWEVHDENGTPVIPIEYWRYNDFGQLVEYENPLGTIWKKTYISTGVYKGLLESEIADYGNGADNLNLTTSYSYANNCRVATITDPEGNVVSYTYDYLGNLLEVTGMIGGKDGSAKEVFAYDDQGRKITDELYDAYNNLVRKTTNTYNDAGWLISQSVEYDDGYGGTKTAVTSYAHNGNSQVTEVEDPLGNKTRTVYDERGLVYTTTRGYGSSDATTMTYNFDGNGNTVEIIDGMGNSTLMEYDGFDRNTVTTDAIGRYTVNTYSKMGIVIKEQRFNSLNILLAETEEMLDGPGRIKQIKEKLVDPTGTLVGEAVTEYKRDIFSSLLIGSPCIACGAGSSGNIISGNVREITDPLWNSSYTRYDNAGRVVYTEDAVGNYIETTLDGNGRQDVIARTVIDETDLTTRTYTFINDFDNFGNLISVKDDDGNVTFNDYNSLGLLVKTTDANGNTVNFASDGMKQIMKEIINLRVNGIIVDTVTTAFDYNLNGQRISIVDDNGHETTYKYDSVGRYIETEYADGGKVTVAYNPNSQVATATDQNGTVITNIFDEVGRLTARAISRGIGVIGTTSENYSFDDLDRLLSTANNDATVSYTYDTYAHGLVVTEARNGKNTVSRYNKLGQRIQMEYPTGKAIALSYKANGLLDNISENHTNIVDYNYIGMKVRHAHYANGITMTNDFDTVDRLATRTYKKAGGQAVVDLAYGWDAADNKLYEEKLHQPSASKLYHYDSLNRLVAFERGRLNEAKDAIIDAGQSKTWDLDGLYNWNSVVENGIPETRIHEELNELTQREKHSINAYAIFGKKEVTVGSNVQILSGDIGTNGTKKGAFYLKRNAVVESDVTLRGDKLTLGRNTLVKGNVCYNSASMKKGAQVLGDEFTPIAVPVIKEFPEMPDFTHGSQDVIIKKGSTATLSPGEYGDITIGKNCSVAFDPGTYSIKNLEIKQGTVCTFTDDTTFQITKKLIIGKEVSFNKNKNVPAEDVKIYHKGTKECSFGKNSTAYVNVYAPNTEVALGMNGKYKGAFIGKKVNINKDASISFANGWGEGFGTETLVYDNNGNLIDDGERKYLYDYGNRLKKITKSVDTDFVIADYTFDTLGRRIRKNVDADRDGNPERLNEYYYSNDQVVEEYLDNSLYRTFVYGIYIDEPVQVTDDTLSKMYYFAVNQQYSALTVFDDAGKIAERYEYNSYGRTRIYTGSGDDLVWFTEDDFTSNVSMIGNPYMFAGRRYDSESGLYYFRERTWDWNLGRFMQRDPIGYGNGWNLYNGYFVPEGMDPYGRVKFKPEPVISHPYTIESYNYFDERRQRGDDSGLRETGGGITDPLLTITCSCSQVSDKCWRAEFTIEVSYEIKLMALTGRGGSVASRQLQRGRWGHEVQHILNMNKILKKLVKKKTKNKKPFRIYKKHSDKLYNMMKHFKDIENKTYTEKPECDKVCIGYESKIGMQSESMQKVHQRSLLAYLRAIQGHPQCGFGSTDLLYGLADKYKMPMPTEEQYPKKTEKDLALPLEVGYKSW